MAILKIIHKNAYLFALLWAIVIFILCATPGQYIPSANWLELLSFDKFVHAGMFFILASLLFVAVVSHNQSRATIFIYLFACIVYGIFLEIMQATCFSNRSADWKDVVANSFGCLLALMCLNKIKKVFANE
jgi:VanZ family protein